MVTELEEELRTWQVKNALEKAGFTEEDMRFTFENFDPNRTGGTALLALCRAYADNVEPKMGVGLLLWGQRGVGKTHLAVAILRRALERGLVGAKISFAEFLASARSFFETDNLESFLDCAEYDIVLLDDVSSQTIAGSFDQSRACEALFRFLDSAYLNRANLLITTNHAPTELAAELRKLDGSERILDRLRGLVHSVHVEGESQRRAELMKRTPPWLREALQKVKGGADAHAR